MLQTKPDALHIPAKQVVSVYLFIHCEQISALLATERIALISELFCNMGGEKINPALALALVSGVNQVGKLPHQEGEVSG